MTVYNDLSYEVSYEDPDAPDAEPITVYAQVPADWAGPCCWAWSAPDGTNAFSAWPGEAMTEGEDGWYSIEVPGWVNSIIINANEGGVQTSDLSVEVGKDVWISVADAENATVSYEQPGRRDARSLPRTERGPGCGQRRREQHRHLGRCGHRCDCCHRGHSRGGQQKEKEVTSSSFSCHTSKGRACKARPPSGNLWGYSMKKFFSLLLALVMVFSLAACGSQEADTNTIVIWHDKEDAVAEVLQSYLNEALPDLNITLEKKTSLTDSLKLVGNDPSSAPDMFIFAHDKIGVFAEMGILAPVEGLLPEGELTNYLGMTTEAATYKGTVYQLPLYFETLLFMYNRRYMTDDMVPSTTEELYSYMGGQHRPRPLRLCRAALYGLLLCGVDTRLRRRDNQCGRPSRSPTRTR